MATDAVIDDWYAAFDRQAVIIERQAALIARCEETIEILRAELAMARAR